MLKKSLSIILVLVLCAGMATITAQAADVSLTLSKTNYTPNEDMKISVSGITDEMVKAGAFAGLYASGAAYNKSLKQSTLKSGSSTVTLKAPATAGTYEVRVYQRGAPCLKKVTFTVGTSVPAKTQTPTPKPAPKPTPTPARVTTSGGSIDPAIIGHWRYRGYTGQHLPQNVYYYDYYFNDNGSFTYFYTWGGGLGVSKTEGKFSTSNGKVYMTDLMYNDENESAENNLNHYDDRVHEYEVGTDDLGKYLNIGSIRLLDEDGTYVGMSWAITFRDEYIY